MHTSPSKNGFHAVAPAEASSEPVPTFPAQPPSLTDRIARPRDKKGNRLPWSYAYSVPTVDGTPVEKTPLQSGFDIIGQEFPLDAAEVAHFYNHKLLESRGEVGKSLAEETDALACANARATDVNRELDAAWEQQTAPDRQLLAETEAAQRGADRNAAEQFAAAGRDYDPATSDAASLLGVAPIPERVIAARLQMPWTPSETQKPGAVVFGWVVTVILGTMIGLSMGIASSFIPKGNWFGKPFPCGLFLVTGIAAAACAKKAISGSAREASLRYWMGRPASNWLPFAVVSVVVTGGVMLIYALIERQGLMAGVRMQELAKSLSGQTRTDTGSSEWFFFLMALILIFGYALNAYWEGYLSGRADACWNRILDEQQRLVAEEETQHRTDPAFRPALAALSQARVARQERAQLEARIAAQTAERDTKQLPVQDGLSETARYRIQEARDQFHAAQETYDALFAIAKQKAAGSESLWSRLRPRRSRRPHGSLRESRG